MTESNLITIEQISDTIYYIRGVKVMLDRDLADLYEVETRILKRNVRRHIDRFPDDFMFELTQEEFKNWRSQIGTSNSDKMGLRYAPMAFTEQGVAMLSSVLHSDRAIQVNIQIMRTFTRLRHALFENKELQTAIEDLKKQTEERFDQADEKFEIVFSVLDKLLADNRKPKNKIGF
ncbi:MAG: ORF6N domain-containing protein [Desulfobacteraceae bacterium]|nr:ORF6N domain-containing protein [Desulfobacteraceae bacterium]